MFLLCPFFRLYQLLASVTLWLIHPFDQTGIGGPTPWPANPGNVLKTAKDNIDKPVVNGSKNTNPVTNEGNGHVSTYYIYLHIN
jgi:hypothetical protein